eukprot:7797379-Pyramimonas_sp.AAC.1
MGRRHGVTPSRRPSAQAKRHDYSLSIIWQNQAHITTHTHTPPDITYHIVVGTPSHIIMSKHSWTHHTKR